MRKGLILGGIALIASACAWVSLGPSSSPSSILDDLMHEAPPTIMNAPTVAPEPVPFNPEKDRTQAIEGFVPSSFAVIGDFGSGDEREDAVTDRMCAWRKKHDFDVLYTTGDNVYSDGDPSRFQETIFGPLNCMLSNGVNLHASLGNHDVETKNGLPQIRREVFGMPTRNYVIRSNGLRFVVADSNHLNYTWMKRKTRAKTGDHWTIVIFHHPVFSGGDEHGSTPGFADTLRPLFERRGVDLVLNGHDHVYSVTREVKGVRYVVTGGGGAPSYGCDKPPQVSRCMSRLHFLYVTATATELKIQAVPAKGPVIDSFTTQGRA